VIGLDTNILLRYVLQDEPTQSERAAEIIEGRISSENPGFVSVVTLAEMAWVLKSSYRFGNSAIAAVIERLLCLNAMVIECENEVYGAMVALREDRGSFADALIGALGARAGCLYTPTFDRGALRLPGFAAA
jgi:predicted nucleic-acid-binding protein